MHANMVKSPTQAWSAGCLIDLFYDAQDLAKQRYWQSMVDT